MGLDWRFSMFEAVEVGVVDEGKQCREGAARAEGQSSFEPEDG